MSQYKKTMNNIHAPQEQVDLALDRVYQPCLEEIQPKKSFKYKVIGGLAAAVAVAVGVTAFAANSGTHSGSFTITANAAEITAGDFVQVGTLSNVNNGSSVSWSEDWKILSVGFDKDFNFNVNCQGSGIEKITYSVSDGAYFVLEPNPQGVTDTVAYTESDGAAWIDDESNLVTAYTVDASAQFVPTLNFHAEEEQGKYCAQLQSKVIFREDENGLTEVVYSSWDEEMCCDMFNEYIHPTLTVTARYGDGSVETQTVEFEFVKGTRLSQDADETELTEHTVVEVQAKLAK